MLQFIGAVSFGAPLPPKVAMEQAARRLGGPDFEPVRSWRAGSAAFAWRRLPLFAESVDAPVPVFAREGALALVGSGRIDAQSDLVAALDLDPARAWSDTELMLGSVARWGEAGVNRLMGNFGFTAWDQAAERLLLARDYFGSVPLIYHAGDGFVVFGTNPAAILALGLCSREIDSATLGDNLIRRSVDPESTIYKDLRRVRRGATRAFDRQGDRQTIYWRPARGPKLKLKDDAAYVEATRAMLDEVHRGYRRALHPIGVMLSGGFDSGAVAATLARLMPEREIFGFTTIPVPGDAAYARGQGREWAHVQSLARMYPNLTVQAVADKSMTPLDPDFRDFFNDTGLPLTGIPLMARRLALMEAARARGVRLLLNGDAGNITLTREGDDIFAELFHEGRWLDLAREIWGSARFSGRPLRDVIWKDALYDIVPRGWLRAWRRLKGTVPHAGTDHNFVRLDFARDSGLKAKWQACPHDGDAFDLTPMRDKELLLLDIQPSYADGVVLAHARMGLDAMAPLRDRRLIDFIYTLPAAQFRRNGTARFLARRVLAGRLPAATLDERGYFESFADAEHWLSQWWDEAARKIEREHPANLAAEAIDLPALRACLAKGPPVRLPLHGPERDQIGGALPNAVHINQFLRWHQGMND